MPHVDAHVDANHGGGFMFSGLISPSHDPKGMLTGRICYSPSRADGLPVDVSS
jgi:hypothetical protein